MSLMTMLKNNLSKTKSHTTEQTEELKPEVKIETSEVVSDKSVDNEYTIRTGGHAARDLFLKDPVQIKAKAGLKKVEEVVQETSQSSISPDLNEHSSTCTCHDKSHIHSVPTVKEVAAPEEKKIETIPLSDEEIAHLHNNGYLEAKNTCTKTFLIEKTFIGYAQGTDPTNPVRKAVKVKRVAELKAVSLMHALNMIGWDKKNVVVINVEDDYNGQIQVQVNGKSIGKVKVDNTPKFESLSGGQQNARRKEIMAAVSAEPLVKEYLHHNGMEVVKCVYVPYRMINLVTKKVGKQKVCTCDENCKCSCINVG